MVRALTYAHLHFATNMADAGPRRARRPAGREGGHARDAAALLRARVGRRSRTTPPRRSSPTPRSTTGATTCAAQRKFRPYLLSEPEEKIVTEKTVSGVAAWSRLYEEQLGALRVPLDGEDQSLETAMARLYEHDRDTRRGAAEAITEALGPGLRTRTYVFNTILQDKSIDDRLRGYPTWISSRNLSNETTDEAVEALIAATTSRYDVAQRYYRLKAKLLGIDRLAHYDRFAPVSEDAEKTPWDEAQRLVVEAYGDFSDEAGSIVSRFFDDSWIDAPVRRDKRTGAFCATTVPGVHPYILMNYTGDRRSILTLAHELGHGLHGVLSQPLGLFNSSTPLTTAETASVFGEALTFERLLAGEEDPRRRLDLLTGRIEDAIATTFRQIAMNRFEHATHTERREQGELASERIARALARGAAATSSATPSTSRATSPGGATSRTSRARPATSTPTPTATSSRSRSTASTCRRATRWSSRTSTCSRSGGSRSPEELAVLVGLDLTDPAIWSSGIDALAEELDEAERLAAEIGLGAD